MIPTVLFPAGVLRNRYWLEDIEGNLQPGHMDYMVNNPRATAFAAAVGLPWTHLQTLALR